MDKAHLQHILREYLDSDNRMTFQKLDEVYKVKDKYGQPLPLPQRKFFTDDIDNDKDGFITLKELERWKGYQGKEFCRHLGDRAFGCIDKCINGVDAMDGDPLYFEKYMVLDLPTKSAFSLQNMGEEKPEPFNETEGVRMRRYIGQYSDGQKQAVSSAMQTVLAGMKPVQGAVVQMGLKDIHSWRFLHQQATAYTGGWDVSRSLHIYDTFEGFGQCDYEVDTGQCPPKGSSRVGLDSITRDAARFNHDYPLKVNVHKAENGDYSTLKDSDFPEKIAFALIDGSFYSTTLQMLTVLHKFLSPGGIVMIHDFGYEGFPGIERAVSEYVGTIGKGNRVLLPGTSNGVACYMGIIKKKLEKKK